ncbi:MAG: glycosyltransferase family 2 protein [Selenomonadaceae bacterium]|nr:glycosyltransferase family 2 protein [Selenomonadaceae bacterium]
MPKISVVVPIYKVEKYLRKSIDSLINQTLKDIEIILVDDGSPDNCGAICDEYAANDSRIKVIHQKNKGLAGARDAGIAVATSDYIGFLDSDDFAMPDMYECMMAEAEKNDADVVISDYFVFNDEKEDELSERRMNIPPNATFEFIRDGILLDHYASYAWNKIYKRELFTGFTVPPDMYLEDVYMCSHILAKSSRIGVVPKPFICYRQHLSIMDKISKTKRKHGFYLAWSERERVCEEHGFDKPLMYCRRRAQEAAIALKIYDYFHPYMSQEEKNTLDNYLADIPNKPVELQLRHKLRLWIINHVPKCCWMFFSPGIVLRG